MPSNVQVPPAGVRALPLVHSGAPIGRWTVVAWDPQRFLAPYAKSFIDELVAYCRRHYPGREFAKRVPPLPKPEETKG
ncbi:DNA-binding transcriptional LysR family regulator [Bradyrhizobium sp. URHC0002]